MISCRDEKEDRVVLAVAVLSRSTNYHLPRTKLLSLQISDPLFSETEMLKTGCLFNLFLLCFLGLTGKQKKFQNTI